MSVYLLLYLFILFLFGISVGSFINVVVDRNGKLNSVLSTRSYCVLCKKGIRYFDLIPLVSYLLLGGKCRHCGGKISPRVFIVELVVGLSFVVVGIFSSVDFFTLVLLLVTVSLLLCLLFVDVKHYVLPDYLLLALFAMGVLLHINEGFYGVLAYVGFGMVYFLAFLLLFLLTRGRGIGFGDVKFAFVIGVILGVNGIVAIYLSFVSGAVVALSLVVLKQKKLRGDSIPFGPFLVFGTLCMLLFSEWVYYTIFSILG